MNLFMVDIEEVNSYSATSSDWKRFPQIQVEQRSWCQSIQHYLRARASKVLREDCGFCLLVKLRSLRMQYRISLNYFLCV